jgi:uncharacterized protein involved in exopolysaccharide biosynthesis
MEFYRIWRILIGQKWLLICLPVIAGCAGLGLSYVLPELYESTALVLVRPGEPIKFNAAGSDRKEVLDFPLSQSAPMDAPSKTYMEVIKSRAVAIKIVEALRLDIEKPKKSEGWFGEIKDDVKTWISDTVQVLRNYARYGRDIPATPFDKAVGGLEQGLKVAVRKDTYAFDITYLSKDPKEAAAVANMAAEIFLTHSAEAYRTESERARKFIEAQLEQSGKALEQARAAILAHKMSGSTFEITSEYIEKLKILSDLENMLAKTEGKLAGMRSTYNQSSPVFVALEAEKAEIKEQISGLRVQLAAYPEKERKINALTLTERLAKDSYEFFLKRYEEARIRESSVVSEIRIISPAVPALYPTKPVKILYAGLSLAVGLVVAICWALFFEPLDPRVRTIGDLDELGLPVLGVIPTLKAR